MMQAIGLAIGLAMIAIVDIVHAGGGVQLQLRSVIDDEWAWFLKNNPVYATMIGSPTDDRALDEISLAAQDRRAHEAQAFIARLDAIPEADLDAADLANKVILRRVLAEQVEANGFGQRMILFSAAGGLHNQLADLQNFIPLRTKADHENLLARYERYRAQNDEVVTISRRAIAEGYVQPCVAMQSFEGTVSRLITQDVAQSRFYQPFVKAKPKDANDREWAALQARAKEIVTTRVDPANAKLLDFYRNEYAPRCSKAEGVSTQPDGLAYYAFKIRQETTTNLSAAQIHRLGLQEVARVRGEMSALATKAGFADREAFIAKLRSDPDYYPRSPEELMRAVARLTKAIDGKMPALFGLLPRLPYGIREIPSEIAEGNTTACYSQGSPVAGLAGIYYVNTTHLDQRPFWELPALTLHEAVPGHHHQIALQQELDLPEFRRYAVFFTAFVEGWGLYAEHLGIELGIYDTPEKDMGRLSYEMWRACRLAVDTGLHTMGWSKAQAVRYLTDNTALSAANIEAEVNRYIAGPGQALAYKLGELEIPRCAPEPKKRSARNSMCAAFTTRSWVRGLSLSTSLDPKSMRGSTSSESASRQGDRPGVQVASSVDARPRPKSLPVAFTHSARRRIDA